MSFPWLAHAYEVKTGSSVYIAQDKTIDGNLYAAGNTITVDGTVKGDVICGAQTVTINGTVEGDVICGAQTINISGPVNGSVRAAGNSIIIDAPVAHGVQAFGANITLTQNAAVGWGMLMVGETGEIRGKIGRDLYGAAASVTIAGEVGRDVKLRLDDRIGSEKRGIGSNNAQQPLTVADSAKIGGNLYYTAGQAGNISSGAQIGGEVGFSQPKKKPAAEHAWARAWSGLYSVFAALVIGLVLVSLWREPVRMLTDRMLSRIAPTIGWGAVVMLITPFILIMLLITVIGIPLALIVGVLWLIAIYLSKILVGILVGRSILDRLAKGRKDSLIWAMIIGIIIVWLAASLPIIGWLIALVAIWWGLGGIWLTLREL